MLNKAHPSLRPRTDKGSEFNNKDVAWVLKNRNVEHFTTQKELKASFAERLIKTL